MTTYETGAVAVATVRGVPDVRVMRCDYGDSLAARWVSAAQLDRWVSHPDLVVQDIRPLAVLDLSHAEPEGQAPDGDLARFLDDLKTGDAGSWVAMHIEAQILRPNPPEPTGLGAVIEDVNGERWTNTHQTLAWVHQDLGRARYADLNVARVLSEGVEVDR